MNNILTEQERIDIISRKLREFQYAYLNPKIVELFPLVKIFYIYTAIDIYVGYVPVVIGAIQNKDKNKENATLEHLKETFNYFVSLYKNLDMTNNFECKKINKNETIEKMIFIFKEICTESMIFISNFKFDHG